MQRRKNANQQQQLPDKSTVQSHNIQKGINSSTTKNTYIDLGVQEQSLTPEELERHTAHTSSGSKNQNQQQRHVVMERRNTNREQVTEQ